MRFCSLQTSADRTGSCRADEKKGSKVAFSCGTVPASRCCIIEALGLHMWQNLLRRSIGMRHFLQNIKSSCLELKKVSTFDHFGNADGDEYCPGVFYGNGDPGD